MNTLKEYMEKYGKNYSDAARNDIYELFDSDIPVDLLLQIKSKLNLIPEEKDVYNMFINKLDEHGVLNGKILEVSCGFYPILAEKIIKTHNVDMTCIDPRLVTEKSEGLHLIKGTFPTDINLEKYDGIISLLPCEATVPIIRESFKYDIPYFLVLCKCTHFDNPWDYMPISYIQWENYVVNLARSFKKDNDEIIEDNFKRESGEELLVLKKTVDKK